MGVANRRYGGNYWKALGRRLFKLHKYDKLTDLRFITMDSSGENVCITNAHQFLFCSKSSFLQEICYEARTKQLVSDPVILTLPGVSLSAVHALIKYFYFGKTDLESREELKDLCNLLEIVDIELDDDPEDSIPSLEDNSSISYLENSSSVPCIENGSSTPYVGNNSSNPSLENNLSIPSLETNSSNLNCNQIKTENFVPPSCGEIGESAVDEDSPNNYFYSDVDVKLEDSIPATLAILNAKTFMSNPSEKPTVDRIARVEIEELATDVSSEEANLTEQSRTRKKKRKYNPKTGYYSDGTYLNKCSHCSVYFVSERAYLKHIEDLNNREDFLQSALPKSGKRNRTSLVSQQGSLESYKKTQESESCGKAFCTGAPHNEVCLTKRFQMHNRTSNNEPFTCYNCPKTFRYLYKLVYHHSVVHDYNNNLQPKDDSRSLKNTK